MRCRDKRAARWTGVHFGVVMLAILALLNSGAAETLCPGATDGSPGCAEATALVGSDGAANIGAPYTAIGAYSFKGNAVLTSVTLSADVTAIGERAFWGCASLAAVIGRREYGCV